jgi:adenine phosphoribosyltransferase
MSSHSTLDAVIRNVLVSYPNFPLPGIVFKDIAPVFSNPELVKRIVNQILKTWKTPPDVVLGIESRGFLLGSVLAYEWNRPFIMARKKGKLPGPVLQQSYSLEYNTAVLELQQNALIHNQNVLITDDVLATGGTASAAAQLVLKSGARILGFQFLLTLENLKGTELLRTFEAPYFELIRY